MTKYYADAQGRYLGAVSGHPLPPAPVGGIEVAAPPADAAQIWDAELEQWVMPAAEAARRTIGSIEHDNPITHRALRELILALGELYPAAKATPFYWKAKLADDAIRAERAKL